ncbi:MAG: hypothetical protein P8X74_21735 [Reinekea sp.]
MACALRRYGVTDSGNVNPGVIRRNRAERIATAKSRSRHQIQGARGKFIVAVTNTDSGFL